MRQWRKERAVVFPFDLSSLGQLRLLFAVVIGIVGLLLIIMGNIPFFGKLPGNVVIRRGGGTFFFPIVACIVISVILTILINLIFWIFRR